jgi:hypothetical protein
VTRVLSLLLLAVLWVGAVRLIVGAVPASSRGRMRARVGWGEPTKNGKEIFGFASPLS